MKTVLLMALGMAPAGDAPAYPIDGYEESGIRRVERLRRIAAGELEGPKLSVGARLPADSIRLHLVGRDVLPDSGTAAPDSLLQARLTALFPDRHESYAVALMEVSPGRAPRAAYYQADRGYSPGSVGKIAIAVGLFAELERRFPDDPAARAKLLREREVMATDWVTGDHHVVPLFDPETGAFESRKIAPGDTFNLYEWADHMMSASANSAASTLWKELILMRAFGEAYPPSSEAEADYFANTPKGQLGWIGHAVVNEPLRAMGIGLEAWRLGSLFTKIGQRRVPVSGGSLATPDGMLTFLVRVEQGRAVDAWSSLELKKLMYMTARRIRYASSPALARSAVYFKSGSLYRCAPEPDFQCRKYHGNVENAMNSVAIVERPDGTVYLVALMSNVLRKNSAVDHQSLATEIDRLIR